MASCTSPGGQGTPSDTTAPTTADTAAPTDTTSPTPTEAPATGLPTPIVTEPPASTNLDGISATGAFGDKPTLTVPFPWVINSTQTKILVQGTGSVVPDQGWVQINYLGMNGRTGEVFDNSYDYGSPVSFPLTGVIPGFQKGLSGKHVGDRLIIAIPGADGYDSASSQPTGIEIGDTLVFVVDIVNTSYDQPSGTTVTPSADPNLPVVGGTLTAPTVTIPQGATPPTSLVVQPLIVGPGAKVAATDTVIVNYVEYLWSNGTQVRTTYGFAPLSGLLSSTIQGWQTALVNQTAGSRLLLVVPPSLAYPNGNPKIGVPANSTMVFVIDIVFSYYDTSSS